MLDFTCQNETAWRCRHDLCTGVRCRGDGHGPGDDLCGEAPLGEGPCSCGGRPGERGTGTSPSHGRASLPGARSQHRRGWTTSMAERLLEASPATKKGTWTRCAMHRAALVPPIHQIPEYPTGKECRIWGLGGVARWRWRGMMETGVASLGMGSMPRLASIVPNDGRPRPDRGRVVTKPAKGARYIENKWFFSHL